jgi:hypothetical protein
LHGVLEKRSNWCLFLASLFFISVYHFTKCGSSIPSDSEPVVVKDPVSFEDVMHTTNYTYPPHNLDPLKEFEQAFKCDPEAVIPVYPEEEVVEVPLDKFKHLKVISEGIAVSLQKCLARQLVHN